MASSSVSWLFPVLSKSNSAIFANVASPKKKNRYQHTPAFLTDYDKQCYNCSVLQNAEHITERRCTLNEEKCLDSLPKQ